MLFLRHEPTEKLREDELSILLLATQKLGLPAETRKKECRNITRFATVVNLSMKINENVRKFKEIFTVISEILQEKHEFIKIKDEMMILELILQENTGFLLEFDSPFKFLILILKDLNLPKEIGKKSWKITQYSLFSPVILQIVPHAVAFSAIYISVILSNEKGNLSVKMLEKYYLSQDQVFKGVTGILKLLLNKKIQENFKIGENQDLILKILNSVETKGLVDTGFLLHSNKSPYPRQNMGHNHGYGQNQYHGYGHGNAQSHGRPNHVGFGERRPAHTPAPVIHTGYSGNMLSSSGPGHASVPDKRKHSDQYDKRDSRGDSRSGDYDRRQKCSSTDSYSDDSYDRDHDKNYRSSRDERDAYHGRGGDYERKSDRRDDKNHVGSGKDERKSFTAPGGMGLPAHTPAPVIHTGYSGNMLSSSGPGYASVPDKRKHSDQYEKRDSRGDSRSRDYDRRQKYSSTDSYSDDSYDRDHDKDNRNSRDERDDYHGKGREYKRRSDRRDDKVDDRDYKRKSYDHGNSDHRRHSYDHGSSRYETGRHRNESKYYRDARYSNKRRDGSSYQSQSSYHSRR